MITTDTLTSRLHAQADADLKKEIDDHLKAIFEGFEYDRNTVPHEEKYLTNKNFDKVWWYTLRDAVAELAFNGRAPARRNAAISIFMGKVEELQNLIPPEEQQPEEPTS